MTDAVFQALADPTRRDILERLGRGQQATATTLAAELDISRQAVAKHLGQLADAGLATAVRVGRETRYRPDPDGLEAVTSWVRRIEHQWAARLERLGDALGPPPP